MPFRLTVTVSRPGALLNCSRKVAVGGCPVPATGEDSPVTNVVSVLSSADIARTGDGDISGWRQRVTGLSVVGGGFVFVRGLGVR